MDPSVVEALDAEGLLAVLPGFLSRFFTDTDVRAANRQRVEALVHSWSEASLEGFLSTLQRDTSLFQSYPASPAGRDLSRCWSRDAITHSETHGLEHLREAADKGPTVVLCTHLSYFDASATDAILAWSGHADLANRLTFAAGPKVYQHLFRKVAATCLNTILVPQSTALAHTDRISQRELAMRAIRSMKSSRDELEHGNILLIYPEGTRSRDGTMGSFIKGVHRYLTLVPNTQVVPAFIAGTEHLMSVDNDERIQPGEVSLTFLPSQAVSSKTEGRAVLLACRAQLEGSMPQVYRPHKKCPEWT